MRSSNLIFIAGLIFILLTDTIFWIQLKQYLNKKWQILLYGLHTLFFLTSSLRTPKFFVKEFSYFLMPCHQHGLRINLLVQR